jgi:phage baseplate assembly protein W
MNLAYPYQFAADRRTAEVGDDAHLRDLIEQVLFTSPGERVMRPDFGSGVMQLVFAPNSPELAGATQALIHAALQQWLGSWMTVLAVAVEADDAVLKVTVKYQALGAGLAQVQVFTQAIGGGT